MKKSKINTFYRLENPPNTRLIFVTYIIFQNKRVGAEGEVIQYEERYKLATAGAYG